MSEHSLTGKGGGALYVEHYRPFDAARGTLVLVHGLAEHCGRYEHVASYFVGKGFQVIAYDHQGHGRSSGSRGHIRSFDDYVSDLESVLDFASKDALPVYVLSHSMGALITLGFLGRNSKCDMIRSAVLIGTPLKPHVEASRLVQLLGFCVARVLPKMPFSTDLDARYLARNEEVGKAYLADPLVLRKVTAGWFVAFLEAIENFSRNFQDVDVPVLFLHGGDDQIAHPDGGRVAFQSYPSKKKHMHIYEGCYHELLNEEGCEAIFDEILEWYEKGLNMPRVVNVR